MKLNPPRLAVVTCMWQRHDLVRETLTRLQACRAVLGRQLELVIVVAGSEQGISRTIAEAAGALYVETPNAPLSAKWNAAFDRARRERPDAACMIGSDDWTTPTALVELFTAALATGYAGVRDMYLYDLSSGRARHFGGYVGPRLHDTLGALRTIRADVLDRLGWKLFDREKNRALDYEMGQRLAGVRAPAPAIASSRCLLDVKGAGPNICSFDSIQPARTCEPEEIERHLGPGTTAALERLRPRRG